MRSPLSTPIVVKFKLASPQASLPEYSTPGSAGADIRAAKNYILGPGQFQLIETGLLCDIPEGYELQVRPRSGLAAKHGVTVLNTPGTIDSDYKGALGVLLINLGTKEFPVSVGDRIAQIVVAPVVQASFELTSDVGSSDRGDGGFGSTGIS